MLISKGISNLFKVLILLGISLLFLTCDPGLGKAVDTQAPTVAVEFPVTKSVLKGGFVMKGIATDEVKVSDCFVIFKNMATSLEYNFSATVSNGEFTASINTPKEDGTFELPDGDYNVTVTVSDAYRNSTVDVVYTIDNTAPTVLLTSPNSYSVSNWPNMYKTFSIKGEVYDRSNLESVTVFLVDEEGEVLKSVIADGTNTFLASFDTPFDEEKTCYYYAVAKDAGGNENTYCYHKSDIFQLLSSSKNNQTLESDTSVVFPSINTIGYVDQGQTTNLTEMLSRADLVAKKIENTGAKKVDGKIVFPGFNYFKDNAAQIKWLNISNDVSKVAGIAIGSPVLGTIMPPTDGSAINYSTVRVWVAKVPADFKAEDEHNTPEDFKKYLNENLFTSENELETCVVSEGESGDKQVKLTAVGESLNFQVDSNKPGEDENKWISGYYYIKVEFSTESGVTNYDFCKFEVTSGAPVLKEGLFAIGKEKASYYRGYITTKAVEEGLGGEALTSDLSSPVKIDWYYSGTTVKGVDVTSPVRTINPNPDGSYVIAISHEEDGEYTYTLTAAPDSELSTVISRVVVVDTTKPSVEFSTITDGEIKETAEFALKGNIEDANGIEKVEYQLLAGTSQVLIDGREGSGWQEIPKAKSSFNLAVTNLKESVEYTIKIRAIDVAGNVSEDSQCKFTIDLSNPVASIDEPKPEENSSIVFVKDIPVFRGQANDGAVTLGKKAQSAELTYTKDGGNVEEVPAGSREGEFNWDQESGTWTWTPTSSQFNGTGKYDVTLKVTDDTGKITTVSRTVSLDTNVPTIKFTQVNPYIDKVNPEDGYFVNGEISVKFDITENDYIKEIKWYKPDGKEDSQDLGTNAQPTVKIKTTDFADGTKLGQFKLVVTDRSGNEGVYTGAELSRYEINQDSDKPTIGIDGINPAITTEAGISADNNLFSTSDSISITFKDDDGVASGTYQIDGNSAKTINGGNAKVKTETISLNGLDQGAHTIKLSVRDTNGKEVSTETIYFGIDDKAPELIIDGYSAADIDAGFKNANFDITGLADDSYEFGQLIWNYDGEENSSVIERSDDKKWILNISKPASSQKKTIKFVATDKFLRTTVKTFTYAFDLDKPNLVIPEEQRTSITDKYFNQSTMVTLSGTANDLVGDSSTQSGLKFVQYGVGEGHNADSVNSDGWQNANGSTDWTVLLNIPKYQDGQYTLLVKAVDNSDNDSEVKKFNITADSTSPVLTEGGSADASGTSYSSGMLSLSGTVTEKNLNSLVYTYVIDGVNQETSEIIYRDSSNPNEKIWSVTKYNLEDGTHIFNIFATDNAGNQTVITRNVIIDKIKPTITTNVSPQIMYNDGTGEKLTVNGEINVSVRVAETNKLKGVYYTFKDSATLSNEADWSGELSFNDEELSAGKTILINTLDYNDGEKLPLRIKAIDEAGNFSIEVINPVINQKSDQPIFDPSNFESIEDAGWKGSTPYNVFGTSNPNMIFTVSDDDSVKEYIVSIDDGEPKKVDVNSAQKIVTYSVKDLPYVRHKITLKVVDDKYVNDSTTPNNVVEEVFYIAIDDGQPKLTLNNASGQFVGERFEISGKVLDENGIECIHLQSKESSSIYTSLVLGKGLNDDGTFSYEFVVPSEKESIIITAIDKIGNSGSVDFDYLVDTTVPTVSFSEGIKKYVDGDSPVLRVEGIAKDKEQGQSDNVVSGIDQVRLKIGSEISGVTDAGSYLATGKVEGDGTLSWSYNLDFAGKAAGSYKVYAQSFDFAGNTSKQETITVYVDTDVPQINVTTENSPDATGIKNIGIRKDAFDITGTVSDNGGIASIIAKIQGVSENLEVNLEDSNWSFTVPNTVDDGKMTIIITATDNCGKTSQETLTVILDTVKPVITFANIENDKILPTKEYEVKGSIDDANGIAKVEYQLYAGDRQVTLDGSSVTNWITVENAKATFSLPLTNLQKNTNYVLKLRATDTAGNITEDNANQRSFILNNDDPSISIISISPQVINGEESSVNGTIKVKATLSDTNKIVSAYYTYESSLTEESDWSGSGNSTPFTSDQISKGIEITVDTTGYDKNNLPLRIKAIDEAGNYKVVPVAPYVNQDLDIPSIVPTNFKQVDSVEECGWKGSETINVFGTSTLNMIFTLSDDDSVKEYWVSKDGGEFKKEADVNSAQKVMSYSLESLKESYGGHSITFRVVDENYVDNSTTPKNYKEQTYYFVIDDGAPILTLDNANGQFVGSSFAIKGNVKDSNGIDKISLSSVGGSGFATKELTLGNGLSENGDFSYAFTETSTKSDINIAVIDRIGNTSYGTLTYKLDGTKPIVNIANGVNAFVDGDSPTLRITGSAVDDDLGSNDNGISGIDQVRLKIGSQITGVNDEDSVLASGKIEDGVMSWSYNLDFTGKVAGSYPVYVQAFDIAGNESEEKTITVYVDTDVPQLSHAYADNFVGVYNGNIVISGTASDASGVKSITAKIQGASGNLTGTFTATSNNSPADWSFNIPANTGDGQLTILVTAKDGCGKSVQETFTATLDTVYPDVTFTDISDDNDDNNTTIETSKTTDKPRVSVTYADSTSGVNRIDYEFYYTDSLDNSFVKYSDSNASGSFTRDKSFSGTVVMKMAESTGSKGPFIFTDSDTDGIWYVKVTVTDEAGNSAEYDSPYFYVDQHKPELEVTSPAQNVNLKKQNDALEVTGTTSDSYGGDIDKVVVKIYHTSYNESQQANFTKTFTKDGSNGTEKLTKNGESYQFTYTWDSANSPFVYPDVYELLVSTYDVAGNETVRTPQKISCDNTAPTITFSRPYSYSVDAFGNVNEGIVVNSPIGDTSIKALADDYSMASIYYQIGGTVDIEATGSIGSSNYKITKLTVENGGVGNDTYGTSVTDVKLDGVNIALAGNWNKLTSANLDFDVEYNTLNMVNAGKTYHADGDKETIQTLDVHFVAVDTAGNINYCKYPLKVDTDTDKPTLLMLSPKTINDVANVGGTATISGTVNDDNAVHSVWMQVELVNGNYNGNVLSGFTALTYGITEPQVLVEDIVDGKSTYSVESTTSYFADKTKWYKVNLGAENSTSTTWNMMLNKNGEFDIAKLKESGSLPNNDALKQTELLIKVKALDTKANDGLSISHDAKAGDSTEFRLIIDSGSPSIIINNIADFPAEGSYIGGNITFDLEFSDDQSITEWKLEAISTASGDNRSMLIASDEYSGSYENGLGKTVTPDKIIVDTANIYAQCGNLIQFKISAKDNSKDPQSQTESPKESYLTFKYTIDNSAPDASYVSTIDGNSYYIDTESIEGDSTGAHRETIERGNHLRIISEQAAFMGKVFDETNGSGIDYVMLYFTKENCIYDPSKVNSFSVVSNHLTMKDVNGNAVSPLAPVGSLKDVVRTSGTSNPYIIVDRAEGMLDSGANGDLDGYDENLKANGDWVVYIKSSNLPDGVYDIHYVVVDFAGNARYYSDTMLVQNHAPTINSIVLATDIDGDGQASIGNDDKGDEYQKFVTGKFTSTGFNVRNSKLKIKVNVTGGTGTLKYYLRYKTKDGEVTTNSSNSGYSTGEFEVTSFLGDSSTPVDYVVWVLDSVEDDLSLSSGETTIDMIMDNKDDVAPVAQFFELNTIVEDSKTGNKDRGSLYNGSGHIEPRGNSPFGNTDGKDPDVSGTIILRGEVFDNQRINYIALNLNGIETPIAQWSENSLKVSDDKIVNIVSKLGLDGHYVEWSYAWDTNSIVAENVNISVIVKDASGKTNTESSYDNKNNIPLTTENMYSRENWGYNKMTVDVVPYITAVYRNGSYNTNRAKSGAYPMLRGQEKNCIEGFNLGTDVSKISVVITENKDGSGYSFAMGSITKSGTSTAFTVTTDSKDGYLSTVVNGIRSINNLNDNSHEYNRESNSYDSKTALWTDDRYVRIWQNNSKDYFPGSGTPVYPSMAIGTSGTLYASFSNYSSAAVYYSQWGGSATPIFYTYDPSEETDICVSGTNKVNVAYSANYHGGNESDWNVDSGSAGGIYCYDDEATSKYSGRSYNYTFNKYELFYHDKMLQQFKNIRVKRKDYGTSGLIHIAYYDRISSSIHYTSSIGNGDQDRGDYEYSWVNIDGGTDGDDYAYYFDGNSTYIEDSKGTYDRFEDTERCAGTGESAGLALTKSGYPVVVYFDASNKVLKLARALRENPKNSDTTWWVQDIKEAKDFLGVSVEAISCEIDSSGYLHIAFQNGKNQLIYIKSTNTSDNGSTRYTFETPVVVAEGVSWVDLTLYGSTPYISFLSGANSYDGLNLAFFDKTIDTNFDGGADGSWEVMVAPLAYKATSIRTCVEVHPSPSTSTWGEAAIGFTPGDYYRVAFYIGSGKGH